MIGEKVRGAGVERGEGRELQVTDPVEKFLK